MTVEELPIVLVPGLGCTARVFDTLIEGLDAYGTPIVADIVSDDSIAGMAERLLSAAPARFALFGFSMGGFVLSEVIRAAPDRVCALGFISTSPRPDTAEQAAGRRRQATLLRDGRFDDLLDTVLPSLVGEQLAAVWAEMARELGAEVWLTQLEAIIARPDYRTTLAGVACPTAVIHGAADRMVPVERAMDFSALIPHATRTIIDGGGHLVLRERPQAVLAALSETLCRTASPA